MQVREYLATDDGKNRTKSRVPATTPMGSLYSSEMLGLREKLKLLDELESRFQGYPVVSKYSEMEKEITNLFGGQFWKTLTEWRPANPVALHVAMAVVARHEVYDTTLPMGAPNPEAMQRIIKADEEARIQMMRKLVELQKQHVLSASQHGRDAQGDPDGQAQRLDLWLRYQTKSRRDFYQALREYRSLKEAEKSAR
jgi:hypothetical protein